MNKFIPQANKLYFTGGSAESKTELMAFDSALQECGIHNANILKVSSVIPKEAKLVEETSSSKLYKLIDPGDFYPAVISKKTSSEEGKNIYAAVAGCKFKSGYGINVELHGSEKSKEEVRNEALEMIEDMANRRQEKIDGRIVFEYNSSEVEETCCVLSAVVYARQ